MNLKNNTISGRQCFRICLLENIAIPMIVVPYVTVHVAGAYHVLAFILGLVLFVVYACVMYRYAKEMPEGMIPVICQKTGIVRVGLAVLYVLRYSLRCAIILLYFSRVAHNYMLRSVPVVMLAIPFVFICGYGALRDIEKRGRLLELLFWWMITPLLFIGVFVISNTNWKMIGNELFDFTALQEGVTHPKTILYAAYLVLIVTSSIELMMYTLVTQRKHQSYNTKKIIAWIVVAFVFSYTFVFGILGRAWVGSDSMASLNVMEAAAVPFGLMQRMDYAVLAFWIIGVFAMLSGYLFYANQYGMQCVLKQDYNTATVFGRKEFDPNRRMKENLMMLGITCLVLLFMFGWQWNVTRTLFTGYLVYVDLWISLLVPFIMTRMNKAEKKTNEQIQKRSNGAMYSHGVKTFLILCTMCIFGATLTGCGKRYESASVEKRDYVENMRVQIAENPSQGDTGQGNPTNPTSRTGTEQTNPTSRTGTDQTNQTNQASQTGTDRTNPTNQASQTGANQTNPTSRTGTEQTNLTNQTSQTSTDQTNQNKYEFVFEIANLEEYASSATGKLESEYYSCEADCLEAAIALYYDETGQQLDLGHMEEIVFAESVSDAFEQEIIEEFADMPFVPKSIPVYEDGTDDPVTLREKIKKLFAGQVT